MSLLANQYGYRLLFLWTEFVIVRRNYYVNTGISPPLEGGRTKTRTRHRMPFCISSKIRTILTLFHNCEVRPAGPFSSITSA